MTSSALDYDLKSLVSAIVRSEYYRAEDALEPLETLLEGDPEREAGAGLGRHGGGFLTPEQLHRKIEAVTGYTLADPVAGRSPDLLGDYRLFYGGIDSRDVVKRITDPERHHGQRRVAHGQRGRVQDGRTGLRQRTAPTRRLFPEVEVSFTPEDENGFEIAGAVAAIKRNIAHLHKHVLGESLAPT